MLNKKAIRVSLKFYQDVSTRPVTTPITVFVNPKYMQALIESLNASNSSLNFFLEGESSEVNDTGSIDCSDIFSFGALSLLESFKG
jgi:hypothetical protein